MEKWLFLSRFSLALLSTGLLLTKVVEAAPVDGIPWSLVGPQILNFSLFAIVLFFLLRKKIQDLFVQREKDYTQELRKAERERDEAEKQKLKILQRLETLEEDAKVASQKARSEAENLKSQILSEANSVSERSLRETERTIQYEFDKAIMELREDLLSKAFESAESLLKEKVDTPTQQTLNEEFSKKMQVVLQ